MCLCILSIQHLICQWLCKHYLIEFRCVTFCTNTIAAKRFRVVAISLRKSAISRRMSAIWPCIAVMSLRIIMSYMLVMSLRMVVISVRMVLISVRMVVISVPWLIVCSKALATWSFKKAMLAACCVIVVLNSLTH